MHPLGAWQGVMQGFIIDFGEDAKKGVDLRARMMYT